MKKRSILGIVAFFLGLLNFDENCLFLRQLDGKSYSRGQSFGGEQSFYYSNTEIVRYSTPITSTLDPYADFIPMSSVYKNVVVETKLTETLSVDTKKTTVAYYDNGTTKTFASGNYNYAGTYAYNYKTGEYTATVSFTKGLEKLHSFIIAVVVVVVLLLVIGIVVCCKMKKIRFSNRTTVQVQHTKADFAMLPENDTTLKLESSMHPQILKEELFRMPTPFKNLQTQSVHDLIGMPLNPDVKNINLQFWQDQGNAEEDAQETKYGTFGVSALEPLPIKKKTPFVIEKELYAETQSTSQKVIAVEDSIKTVPAPQIM